MATKLATMGTTNAMQHTAGIFSDMTVDGPEIGTLVMIVDRAKNLPNRKTMGKQDPYCAARLGKEAKKTETDRRGGQTPRWDQELRFTVHDSPDYYNLKVSLFNDDKRTDLIGETWIPLESVVIPGGGQNDLWHSLNCKGKYAGEIRIELTFYDTRPKMEKPAEKRQDSLRDDGLEWPGAAADGSRKQMLVKRRPLPTDPTAATPSSGSAQDAPQKLSAVRSGPRSYPSPRPNSVPSGQTYTYGEIDLPQLPGDRSRQSSRARRDVQTLPARRLTQPGPQVEGLPELAPASHDELWAYDESLHGANEAYGRTAESEDWERQRFPMISGYEGYAVRPIEPLPQLPPNTRSRHSASVSQLQQQDPGLRMRPLHHIGLPHSHSAPSIARHEPQQHEQYQHPQPDHRQHEQRRSHHHQGVATYRHDGDQAWDQAYTDCMDGYTVRATVEGAGEPTPPPPPMHSNSAPIVPQFKGRQQYASRHGSAPAVNGDQYEPQIRSRHGTPSHTRDQHIPGISPMHVAERRQDLAESSRTQHSPTRSRSGDAVVDTINSDPHVAVPLSLTPGRSVHPPLNVPRHPDTTHRKSIGRSNELPPSNLDTSYSHYSRSPSDVRPPYQDRYSESGVSGGPAQPPAPPGYSPLHRQSLSNSYAATTPRSHPLSQEIPQSRSPQPRYDDIPPPVDHVPQHHDYPPTQAAYRQRDAAPLIKPVAVSPNPRTTPAHSPYGPSPAYEAPERVALPPVITDMRASHLHSTPTRKSVSPRPSLSDDSPRRQSGVPFSPDSYDEYNPSLRSPSTLSNANSPNSSYQLQQGSGATPRDNNGPILGWDGRVIDPSDHLPVDSWAPEPEKKTPTKKTKTKKTKNKKTKTKTTKTQKNTPKKKKKPWVWMGVR
ncbi:hypothetical protein LTR66_014301, partial [Elasticomyces elasticus]